MSSAEGVAALQVRQTHHCAGRLLSCGSPGLRRRRNDRRAVWVSSSSSPLLQLHPESTSRLSESFNRPRRSRAELSPPVSLGATTEYDRSSQPYRLCRTIHLTPRSPTHDATVCNTSAWRPPEGRCQPFVLCGQAALADRAEAFLDSNNPAHMSHDEGQAHAVHTRARRSFEPRPAALADSP